MKISDLIKHYIGSPDRKHRDWFDENDLVIKPILAKLHDLHDKVIENKNDTVLADEYRMCKQQAQKSLRDMKNTWWKTVAANLQVAADRKDYSTFYQGLKAVYGPKLKACSTVKSEDGVLITEPEKVLERWSEHFNGVLNQDSETSLVRARKMAY